MGCGVSSDVLQDSAASDPFNGKALPVVPKTADLSPPLQKTPLPKEVVEGANDSPKQQPSSATPVLPMSDPGTVTKLFSPYRMMCSFEDGSPDDRNVIWELIKGVRLLAQAPPKWRNLEEIEEKREEGCEDENEDSAVKLSHPHQVTSPASGQSGQCDNSSSMTLPSPLTHEKPDSKPVTLTLGGEFGKLSIRLTKEEQDTLISDQGSSFAQAEEALDLSGLKISSVISRRWKPTRVRDFKVRMLIGHGRAIRIVGLSSDNRLLVTGDGVEGRQMLLRCAAPSTGKIIGSLSGRGGTADAPCDLSFSTNGQILATCDQSDTVLIWDMTTFRCKKSIQFEGAEGTELFVVGVRLSPDGKLAVAAAEQSNDEGMNRGRVVIWDLVQKKQKLVFKEHHATVLCVALSPDSQKVMSGGRDGMLLVWLAADGTVLHQLTRHPSGIRSCGFSHCGSMMLSLDAKVFALWSTESGKCFFSQHIDGTVMEGTVAPTLPSPRAERPNKLRFTAAQFIPSGLIMLASSDRIVRFLFPHNHVEMYSFLSKAAVSCASAGTRSIALGDMHGNVYLVDLDLITSEQPLPLPEEPVSSDEEEPLDMEESPRNEFIGSMADVNQDILSSASTETPPSPTAVDPEDLAEKLLMNKTSRKDSRTSLSQQEDDSQSPTVSAKETEISPPGSPFRRQRSSNRSPNAIQTAEGSSSPSTPSG